MFIITFDDFSGDFSSPVPWLEEARSISRQLDSPLIETYALDTSGDLAYWQGDYRRACTFYEETILLNEKTGNQYVTLWSQVHIAYAFLRQGNFQQARRMFEKSISNTQKSDLIIALVFAVEGFASLYVNQDQPERATRLF